MAVDLTQDPSTLSNQEQQRMRAQLLKEGQRSLAYNKITDYANATPTFKKVPKKRKSRAKPKTVVGVDGDHYVTAKITDEGIINLLDSGTIKDLSISKPSPREALLARLNANLRS